VSHRALPAIPLTRITTTPSEQQQLQRQHHAVRLSLTSFNDNGHYTDIHWNTDGGDGGAVRIPTWRRSNAEDPGHYNYLDYSQVPPPDSTVAERQISTTAAAAAAAAGPSGYESLNPAELALLRQTRLPHHYAGVQPSNQDARGYLVPVELTDTTRNHDIPIPQPYTPHQHQGEGLIRHGGLGELGGLRRRAHSYSGVYIGSPVYAATRHSYLELVGYAAATDDPDGNLQQQGRLDASVAMRKKKLYDRADGNPTARLMSARLQAVDTATWN